jgi:hypothetical protein
VSSFSTSFVIFSSEFSEEGLFKFILSSLLLDNIALPSVPENQNEIKTTNTHDDEAYILIDYNRNNKKNKNEIDSSDIQIDIISENVGGDEVLKVQTITSIKETENSEKDEIPSPVYLTVCSNTSFSSCILSVSNVKAGFL